MTEPTIDAVEIDIAPSAVIEPGVRISGWGGVPAERVVIGDQSFIGHDTTILAPDVAIGDYNKIHNHTLVSGPGPVRIGHNGWFGQNVILNSHGGLSIGDNCGVGAYSQLWTHMLYGDVMEGCRFDSVKPIDIGKDVWFVGHCIVSPITAADRSMALVGSVVTRDMEENRVYAGSPAVDITEKTGPQFRSPPDEEKLGYFIERVEEFFAANPTFDPDAIGVAVAGSVTREGESIFDIADRTYSKSGSPTEVALMHFLLPRAKFTPRSG